MMIKARLSWNSQSVSLSQCKAEMTRRNSEFAFSRSCQHLWARSIDFLITTDQFPGYGSICRVVQCATYSKVNLWRIDQNFWPECTIKIRQAFLNCILKALFRNAPTYQILMMCQVSCASTCNLNFQVPVVALCQATWKVGKWFSH